MTVSTHDNHSVNTAEHPAVSASHTNEDFLESYQQYFMPLYLPLEFLPIRGNGSTLYDKHGRDVIDFVGGVAASGLGHANVSLIAALQEQMHLLWHHGNVFTNIPQIELAKRFINHTCFDKIFFCNSGTEAVEAGLKLARRYAIKTYNANKNQFVAFTRSYHGRTLLAVSAGGQDKYWDGFAPLAANITHGEFNNCAMLEQIIHKNVAAVITEPVQAEGGVIPATKEFLVKLRQLCDQHNCALIFDEVQTGMGRSGKLFAYMEYEVEPDIIITSKSIAGGFPLGAILVKAPFDKGFVTGSHGSTFGGNPLACSVGIAAFDIINNNELLTAVKEKSQFLHNKLTVLNGRYGLYKEIRGLGLLVGAELIDKFQGKAVELMRIAIKHNVAILNAGANVTRLLPALTISMEELDAGILRLESAINEFIATVS